MNSGETPGDGRVALVTGAASGIGLACAERLLHDGYRVMMTDLNDEALSAHAKRLGTSHVSADLTGAAACEQAVASCVAAFGALDVLVCNAGVQHIDAIADFPEERWNTLLALMLTAPFLLTKHAWPHLIAASHGRVVHIGSAHSLVASPYKAAYVSAKHGLVGLAKVTALEGGAHGLTCNVVAPAYVRTPLVERQVADQARTRGISPADVEEKVFLAEVAIKRMLEPSDVANSVAYLASLDAWAITGSVQSLDLGWTAR